MSFRAVGCDVATDYEFQVFSCSCSVPWGYPLLPGDKPNGCLGLADTMTAKFGQAKGLLLNLGKQRSSALKTKPRPMPGFCLTLLIQYSRLDLTKLPVGETIYLACYVRVRRFSRGVGT